MQSKPTALYKKMTLIVILSIIYSLGGYCIRARLGVPEKWLDPDGTGVIGNNVCEIGEFSMTPGKPDVLRGPAYPWALAIPCKFTGIKAADFSPIINGICHFFTLVLLLRHPLCRMGKAGLIGVFAVCVDPLLFSYCGRTFVEPMFILGVALVVTAIDRLVRQPGIVSAVILGIAWGLSLLVKSTLIYLPIFLLPAFLLLINWRSVFLVLISVLIGLTVISPWSIRNYKLMHKYVPVQIGSWQIMHKGETFSSHVLEGKYVTELEKMAKLELAKFDSELGIRELPLWEKENYYRSRIFENIKKKPFDFFKKIIIQSVTFWILGANLKNTVCYAILQIPILITALVAVRKWFSISNRAFAGFIIVSLYFMAAHIPSLAIARYSMPLRPWLIFVSVNFVVTFGCKVYTKRMPTKIKNGHQNSWANLPGDMRRTGVRK